MRYLEPESGVFVTMANEGSSATLVNIPGTEGIYCGRKVTINSEGYRGPLYEEKQEREFRILVLVILIHSASVQAMRIHGRLNSKNTFREKTRMQTLSTWVSLA